MVLQNRNALGMKDDWCLFVREVGCGKNYHKRFYGERNTICHDLDYRSSLIIPYLHPFDTFLWLSRLISKGAFTLCNLSRDFVATVRHKPQAQWQDVTCLAIVKSRVIFAARSLAQSKIRFYFSQRLPQRCNTFFLAIAQCNIPLATCIAIFLLSS